MVQKEIINNIDSLIYFCKNLNIKSMYLFGSSVSENFNENSDLDFLINFDENLSIEKYTENYFELHDKLKELFGREIDLLTEKSLSNPYFIESINQNKYLIYESKN